MIEYLQFTLNGKPQSLTVDSSRLLLWVLRTDLGLTGTKYGCGESYCGACTVLVNDQAVRSCQMTIKDVQGKEVITIEGLAKNGDTHPLQKAFMEHDALQCGYCTPGFICTSKALLDGNPDPTEADIREALAGNLCRCTGYRKIVKAVHRAAAELRGRGSR